LYLLELRLAWLWLLTGYNRKLLLRGDRTLRESCYLKVLLESGIIPEILKIELLLRRSKLLLIELGLLLLWLAGLCLRRKLLSRKLLL
jgi:hypothetical protein